MLLDKLSKKTKTNKKRDLTLTIFASNSEYVSEGLFNQSLLNN